jgi:hypothetical protein
MDQSHEIQTFWKFSTWEDSQYLHAKSFLIVDSKEYLREKSMVQFLFCWLIMQKKFTCTAVNKVVELNEFQRKQKEL